VIFAIFGCKRVTCDETDEDRPRLPARLRTGTAIGSGAFHEH